MAHHRCMIAQVQEGLAVPKENAMSKLFKSVLIAVAIGSITTSSAWADPYGYRVGGHGGGGWGALGLALFGTAVFLAATAPPPPYYPAPVYVPQPYVPQTVVVTQAATAPAPAPQTNWWYHCDQPAGYYPYISTCPRGWTKVSPVPPGQ